MRRLVVLLAVLAWPVVARAQTDVSRPPESTKILERPGMPDQLLMGTTFGILVSSDGGATWYWLCENAAGYGGAYDPDFVYSPTGAVIATTFDGLRRMTDGCTFEATGLGARFASALAQGSDGTVHAAMSFLGDPSADPPLPADHKIYRSTNDGVDFDAGLALGSADQNWSSILVAPSDAQRLYLTGYRIEVDVTRTLFLYRSINGGTSYTPLPLDDLVTTDQTELLLAAVDPTDPDRVLLRVTRSLGNSGNAFYLTTDGGQSWTKVLEVDDVARAIQFRASGDVVIGTRVSGIYRSVNSGAAFTQVPGTQPAAFCFHERANGDLWTCSEPFAAAPFDAGVLKTTDLAAWTHVMRYQGLAGPAPCAAGSVQNDCCTLELPTCDVVNPSTWCRVANLVQVETNPIACGMPDAGTGGDGTGPPPDSCCNAGGGPIGAGFLVLVVMWGLDRPRRRGSRGQARPARL